MSNGLTPELLDRLRARRAGAVKAAAAETTRRAALQADGHRWFSACAERRGSTDELVASIRRWAHGDVIRFVWAEWLEDEHPDNYVSDEERNSHWPHWYAGVQEAAREFAAVHGLQVGAFAAVG